MEAIHSKLNKMITCSRENLGQASIGHDKRLAPGALQCTGVLLNPGGYPNSFRYNESKNK